MKTYIKKSNKKKIKDSLKLVETLTTIFLTFLIILLIGGIYKTNTKEQVIEPIPSYQDGEVEIVPQ